MLESLMIQAKGGGIGPDAPGEIGSLWEGGYYTGKIDIDGKIYALVLSPRKYTEKTTWGSETILVEGADSLSDGWSNTQAILASMGSYPAAQYCRSLVIDGYDDWYLPSANELEMCYRAFKPTTRVNTAISGRPYGANGINPSSVPPGAAYTPTDPEQTTVSDFLSEGTEAFISEWHWTSSQHSVIYSRVQSFNNGSQSQVYKNNSAQCRAVRRVLIG